MTSRRLQGCRKATSGKDEDSVSYHQVINLGSNLTDNAGAIGSQALIRLLDLSHRDENIPKTHADGMNLDHGLIIC